MRRPRERFTIRLDRPATWDDLLDVPEDFIGEIVAGEIVATPRPANPHATVSSDLGGLLIGPFRFGVGGPGGWVILDEPRVRFGEEIRVPDLGGWRRERYVAQAGTGPVTVIPDWICEILSPSTEADDRGPKMDLYARAGVQHVWLIGWMVRTVEVYRREAAGWLRVATFTGDARVRAEPFDAIELDLALLWSLLPPVPREE
jgi:Uma2 family endonuclease